MTNEEQITDDPELGQLLISGRPYSIFAALFFIFSVLLLMLSIAFLFGIRQGYAPYFAAFGAFGSIILVVGSFLYLRSLGSNRFYFFERGVRHEAGERQRMLRYVEVAELTLHSARVYYHGVYLSSPAKLTLRSSDPREQPFVFSRGRRDSARTPALGDLEKFGMRIAGIMAARMAEQIEQGQDVAWTDKMRLHRDGIEVRDGTIIVRDGKWVPNLVPWASVARVEIVHGMFRLLVQGEKNYRVIVKVAAPNFFPGFLYAVERLPKEVVASVSDSAIQGTIEWI